MSPARSIETLFLDAGSVLVHPNWQRISDWLAHQGVEVPAERLAAADPRARFTIDSGYAAAPTADAPRTVHYMDLVLEYAGVSASPATAAALSDAARYHAEHNLWEHVPADVVPTLEQLYRLGVRLVLVSNANGTVAQAFARLGLARFFNTICDSYIEGVEKPDTKFFEIALARSGARRDTTLHVGDLFHVDIVGARRAGLAACLYDPHDLYGGFDTPRIRSLGELPGLLG